MTLVVPFDGTALAEAALHRATQFAEMVEDPVVAFSVVPTGNTEYTRDRGWVEAGDRFETDRVIRDLRQQVQSIAPEATFRYETVGMFTSAGTISSRVRNFAADVDASIVFVGSENAGHMVVGVSSVGGAIAAENAYDVVIVRQPRHSNAGG